MQSRHPEKSPSEGAISREGIRLSVDHEGLKGYLLVARQEKNEESLPYCPRVSTTDNQRHNVTIYATSLFFSPSQIILGFEPDRRVRRSVYTAAKNLPVLRAGNGNSLTTGNTILNARQNREKYALAYGGVCLKETELCLLTKRG